MSMYTNSLIMCAFCSIKIQPAETVTKVGPMGMAASFNESSWLLKGQARWATRSCLFLTIQLAVFINFSF